MARVELFRFHGILGDDTGIDGYVIVYFDTDTGVISRDTYSDPDYINYAPGDDQSSYSAYNPDYRGTPDIRFECGTSGEYLYNKYGFGMQTAAPFALVTSVDVDSADCQSEGVCDLEATASTEPSYGVFNSGKIIIEATSTNTPIFYSINNLEFRSTPLFENMAPGNYTLYVKDNDPECPTIEIPVTVGTAECTLAVSATSTPATGPGVTDGTITASVTGEETDVEYRLAIGTSFTSWRSSPIFDSLSGGIYLVQARDSTGCLAEASITVTYTANCDFYISVEKTNPTSEANNDGSITITGHDNVGDLVYSVDQENFQTTPYFPGLLPGAYLVIAYVTTGPDAGCYDTQEIVIEPFEEEHICDIAMSLASTNETASGANNGTITVTATSTGGTIKYSKDNGINFQSSNVFTGLAPGTYSIVAEDLEGCRVTQSRVIVAYSAPGCDLVMSTSKTDQTIVGVNNGTVTVTATSTAGGIEYSKDGVNWQSSNVFTGLAPGTYTIRTRDANSCTTNSNVTINAYVCNIVVNATKTDQTAPGVNNGSITASATTSGGALQYSINGGGSWQSSASFTGLAPGTYTVIARDAAGCTDDIVVVILPYTECNLILLSISKTNQTAPGVNNGTITANATSSYSGVEYSINNVVWQSSGYFTGLAPGNYTVYVRDSGGCNVSSPITINAFTSDPLVSTPELIVSGQPSRWNAAYNPVVFGFSASISQKIQIEIMSSGSETGVGYWSPNAAGFVRADISAFLAGLVSPDVRSKAYTIRYRTVSDFGNSAWYNLSTVFRVTYSAMQLGDAYGGNMARYVTAANNANALWMTEFEKPTYTAGLPFDLSFIRSEALSGRSLRLRVTAYAADGTTVLSTFTNIVSSNIEVQSVQLPALPLNAENVTVQVYYVDGIDRNVTVPINIKVVQPCADPFVYLKWINSLGGWDYYRFGYSQNVTLSVANNTVISRPVLDYSTANTIFDIVSKTAGERIQFGSDEIMANQIEGVMGLAKSVKLMLMVAPGKFQTVELITGTYSKGTTRNRMFSANFSVDLPEINIQRQ